MKWLDRVRTLTRISGVTEIARRYFVMNAFDGVLTMIGIVIGTNITGVLDPRFVISTGMAAMFALGISGVSSAFMTEKAERMREFKKLESALLVRLNDTQHEAAYRFAYLFTALVNGLSPMLGAIIVLLPIILTNAGMIDVVTAYWLSITFGIVVLVSLGLLLAKISDEKLWIYGVQMLVVGILTVLLCTAIAMLFEVP